MKLQKFISLGIVYLLIEGSSYINNKTFLINSFFENSESGDTIEKSEACGKLVNSDSLSQAINACNYEERLLYISVIGGTAAFLMAVGGIACAIKIYQGKQRRADYE